MCEDSAPSAATLRDLELSERAASLRLEGWLVHEISNELGIENVETKRLLNRSLDAFREDLVDAGGAMAALTFARYEALWRAWLPDAKVDKDFGKLALGVLAAERELLGLDKKAGSAGTDLSKEVADFVTGQLDPVEDDEPRQLQAASDSSASSRTHSRNSSTD